MFYDELKRDIGNSITRGEIMKNKDKGMMYLKRIQKSPMIKRNVKSEARKEYRNIIRLSKMKIKSLKK